MKGLWKLTLPLYFCACAPSNDVPQDRYYPSDYLFAQRSFPSGKVDLKAYRKAQDQTHQLQNSFKGPFDNKWESLGPTNYCGRVTDVEMPPDNTQKIYMGTASGGIYLSEDQGTTWTPIFDEAQSLSIGDIAIHKKIPSIMYVGTGESNAGGGSLAYDGNGVYRSNDSGQSWTHQGLENAGSIGRVITDPNSSRTVYVGAMGSLFENSSERGVYKSTDSGETWNQILFVSDSTGCIDIAHHPSNSGIVYAAMWERIRRPHNRQYGGATSGLYKTIDGGENWVELTNGLPTQPDEKGRIGIAISESHPDILYAFYASSDGRIQGIYKSEDAGDSWTEKSIRGINNVPYIWWFGRIIIDPLSPDEVYVTSLNMFKSMDGGDSWDQVFEDAHVDHHALFIHPMDRGIIINANDGGLNLGLLRNVDSSKYLTGYSNFQFYKCKIDPNDPSVIYGGAQDNGINVTRGGSEDWEFLRGGDGFTVLVEPGNPQQIYGISQNGGIFGSSNGGNTFYYGATGLAGQFNWNTPVALDPIDPSIVYTGAQSLFKSEDRATSWKWYSQNLTNSFNPTGNLTFGSLTTIDVSSHDTDVIYVGTDDGNVWRIEDDGNTKVNISNGIPKRWITSITHDPTDAEGVYVTVSGFRFSESEAQVFYSRDQGTTWQSIGTSLPDIPVNDLVVDVIDNTKYLYLATDVGVFFSFNEGQNWFPMGSELPRVPIVDLDIHAESRTIAAASYGRGIYKYTLPTLVDVKEINPLVVEVFPNPTSDQVYVSGKSSIEMLEVVDMKGLVLATSQKDNISIGHLPQGNYLLRVYFNSEQPVVTRIVKL